MGEDVSRSSFADLRPKSLNSPLSVKVVLAWKHKFGMDTILMDQMYLWNSLIKGNHVTGSLKTNVVGRFQSKLIGDQTFILSKYGVGENKGIYTSTDHKFKIFFDSDTRLETCSSFPGPMHCFRFHSYENILNRDTPLDSVVDIIGHVVTCGDLTIGESKGRPTKRVKIQLQDLDGNIINCCLWASYAEELSNYVRASSGADPTIIVLQFAKIREWLDKPEVQNAMFSTRLFINHDFDEVNDFKRRLLHKSGGSSSTTTFTQLSSQTVVLDHSSFFESHPVTCVSDIHAFTEDTVCVLVATFIEIQEDLGWFYFACSQCSRKVQPITDIDDLDDDSIIAVKKQTASRGMHCPRCKKPPRSIIPWCMVTINIADDTGTIPLVLFESEICRLLKNTGSEIRQRQIKLGTESDFPEDFSVLLGHKAVFRISVNKYNLGNNPSGYTVQKASMEEHVIQMCENKLDRVETNAASDSVKLGFSSQGGPESKNAVSFESDSSTQSLSELSPDVQPLKRVCSDQHSAVKSKASSAAPLKLVPVKKEKM